MSQEKEFLLLHSLGLIQDADLTQQIESAIDNDPIAAYHFRQFDPDAPEASDELNAFASKVVAQLASSSIERILMLGPDETVSIEDYNSVSNSDWDSYLGTTYDVIVSQRSANTKPDVSDESSITKRSARKYLCLNSNNATLTVEYPEDQLSHGLVWVVSVTPAGVRQRQVCSLSLVQSSADPVWKGTLPLADLPPESILMTAQVEEQHLENSFLWGEFLRFLDGISEDSQRAIVDGYLMDISEYFRPVVGVRTPKQIADLVAGICEPQARDESLTFVERDDLEVVLDIVKTRRADIKEALLATPGLQQNKFLHVLSRAFVDAVVKSLGDSKTVFRHVIEQLGSPERIKHVLETMKGLASKPGSKRLSTQY